MFGGGDSDTNDRIPVKFLTQGGREDASVAVESIVHRQVNPPDAIPTHTVVSISPPNSPAAHSVIPSQSVAPSPRPLPIRTALTTSSPIPPPKTPAAHPLQRPEHFRASSITPTTTLTFKFPASTPPVLFATVDSSTTVIPVLPSIFSTSVLNATHETRRANLSSTSIVVGFLVPFVVLSPIFALLFLRCRKKHHSDTNSPAPGCSVVETMSPPEDAVTPFPLFAATENRLGDGSTGDPTAGIAVLAKAKTAYAILLPVRPQPARARVLSYHAVSDQMAELSAAVQRAGLSVNELMSSLNRVARVDGDGNNRGRARTSGDAMPPQYEP